MPAFAAYEPNSSVAQQLFTQPLPIAWQYVAQVRIVVVTPVHALHVPCAPQTNAPLFAGLLVPLSGMFVPESFVVGHGNAASKGSVGVLASVASTGSFRTSR